MTSSFHQRCNTVNTLCFATNLTSAEWAAWVQAIGSVLAILGAAGIAVWQARKQHDNALVLHAAQQRYAKVELARTLAVLAQNCSKAMGHLAAQVNDRAAIHEIGEGRVHFDCGELSRLDAAISGIPLHSFPSAIVTPTMILSATVRQFREKVEMVFRVHRSMDAAAFEDFFRVLLEMNNSVKATCSDIEKEVERVGHEESKQAT